MENLQINKLVLIPLILLTVLVLSISYALFTKNVSTDNKTLSLKTSKKYIGIYGDSKNNIELNKDYIFTIENRGLINTGYEVYIESNTSVDLSTISYTVSGDFTKTGNLSDNVLVYSALSSNDTKTINIKLSGTGSYKGKIKVRYKDYIVNYGYTGGAQSFITPTSGKYKVELWGASGGNYGNYSGGKGAYASGRIVLKNNDNLYFSIGGTATSESGGYNGGGSGGPYQNYGNGYGGGGATDLRYGENSLASRIMVAGGGAGTSYYNNDGYFIGINGSSGGLTAYDGYFQILISPGSTAWATNHKYPLYGIGGNQVSGGVGKNTSGYCGNGNPGSFGQGGSLGNCSSSSGGGGGGYYGGSSSARNGYSGGGGSSYISGHTGCVAITSATNQSPKSGCTTGTTNNDCSIHYSEYKFTDTLMIDGAGYKWTNTKVGLQAMPNPNGGYYASGVGHSGNGYARITYIEE